MTEPLFAVLCIAFVLVLAAAAWLGWRYRRNQQSDVAEPQSPTAAFTPTHRVDVHYVATTAAENEYDRIVVHGLGLRTRATLAVGEDGIVLELPGRNVFTPASDLVSIERATWTIDRAVEPGGLLRYTWHLGDRVVATNIRVIGDDEPVLQAMQHLSEQEQHFD